MKVRVGDFEQKRYQIIPPQNEKGRKTENIK